jgi:type II secretory pathway pseudopilin PulG
VELLIVIVIIAILAAITLVVFNGIQNRAGEASMKADLSHASKLAESYNAINGQYPASLSVVNENQGFQASKDNEAHYTSTDGTSYCITITRGESSFRISNEQNDPQSGACPGHGPVAAAEAVDYNSANFAANSTNPLSFNTPIQPSDVLVTMHIEHYAVGTANLRVNGNPVTAVHSRSTGTGGRPLRVTIVSGLTTSDSVDFKADGDQIHFAYYLLRGINNPSQVNIAAAGWQTEGDNGPKQRDFTRSISNGQTLKSGQAAILAYVGNPSRIDEFSANSSPAAANWTLHETTQPYNAIAIGTEPTPVPVAVHMLITAGYGQYIAGNIIVIGE